MSHTDINKLFSGVSQLFLESRQVLVVPSGIVSKIRDEELVSRTHVRNRPLREAGASSTSFAITWPGCSGLRSLPSLCTPVNLACTSASRLVAWSSRSCRCISVSTIPGLIDTVVMSGSSAPSVKARWFIAAFVAPYRPHPLYAEMAAPEDVNTILPFDWRSEGIAARTW